jgi:hypothetical protein
MIGQRQRLTSVGSQGSPSMDDVDKGQGSPKTAGLVSQKSLNNELDSFLDEDMTPDLSSVEGSVKYECEEVRYYPTM